MATANDVNELVAKLDQATTAIGTRMKELLAQLADQGLSEAQENEALAKLNTQADALIAMGKDRSNPVPPPPTV